MYFENIEHRHDKVYAIHDCMFRGLQIFFGYLSCLLPLLSMYCCYFSETIFWKENSWTTLTFGRNFGTTTPTGADLQIMLQKNNSSNERIHLRRWGNWTRRMSFIHNKTKNQGASRAGLHHPQSLALPYPLQEVIIEFVEEMRPNDGPTKDVHDWEQVNCWTEDSGWSILWDNDMNTSRYSARTHDHKSDPHSIALLKQFQDHARSIFICSTEDSNNEVPNSARSAYEGQSTNLQRRRKRCMVEF